jgi:plasmid stabilization system protein ParE
VTRRVAFNRDAADDLESIYAYIRKQSGGARAQTFVGDIRDFCDGLVHFPYRGRRRDDISPGLLTVGFRGRVLVAYEVVDDLIIIQRILYGGRDIGAAFKD